MSDELREHFALVGDTDEPSDWHPFDPALVIEGRLLYEDPWPNRWRYLGDGRYDFEIHGAPDCTRLRVCLPFHLDPLPYDGDVIYGYAAVTDEGKPTRQWFEHVDGRTHMIVETLDA